MTADVVNRWIEIVHSGELHRIVDLLAEDAVFYSPAVFAAQPGRELSATYLVAAMTMFEGTGFRYTGTWRTPDSAVLEFAAEMDGVQIEGVDIIRWNSDDRIIEFKVMIRPLKALETVIAGMGKQLSQQ